VDRGSSVAPGRPDARPRRRSARRWPRRSRVASIAIVALVAAGVLIAQLPTAPARAGWTGPTRVVSTPSQPRYSMVVDANGATHIAAEDGGIVYASNATGSWAECRVSSGADRDPSIAWSGGVVHIAFSHHASGELGIRTASGVPSGGSGSCGFPVDTRHVGSATTPSVAAYGSTLHVAFRTPDGRLRYKRGASDATSWTVHQIVDSTCCQSAPAIALTADGSPRIAFGDSSADGLKYAVPSGSSWKKRRVRRGRILHVAMVLDHTPDPWNGLQPANAPNLAYVVKDVGTFHAVKGGSGVSGTWAIRHIGRHSAPPDLVMQSNKLALVYGRGGKVWGQSKQGGIFVERRISGSGRDGYPQIGVQGAKYVVTFARGRSSEGVYRTVGSL